MKAIGIVRAVDPLGRIVIPKELRRVLSIKEGDSLEIFTEGENIILRKYAPGCSCCSDITDGLVEIEGILLCPKCIKKIKSL